MNLNKGKIVYEFESDLEYKDLVEEFVESANLTRSALSQFVNSVIALRDLKEKIILNKESNFLYFISLRKIFDTMELKSALKDVSEQRDTVQKTGSYLEHKIEDYAAFLDLDEELKRIEIVKNMFLGYSNMYVERIEKQVSVATKYMIRVKKIEVQQEEDREYLSNLESEILKNDAKLKLITTELTDIWLKVSDSVLENIVDDIKLKDEQSNEGIVSEDINNKEELEAATE